MKNKNNSHSEFSINQVNCAEMNEFFGKMLNKQINDQKLAYLQSWVGNHDTPRLECNEKIAELESRKTEIVQAINNAKETRAELNILDTFQFNLI